MSKTFIAKLARSISSSAEVVRIDDKTFRITGMLSDNDAINAMRMRRIEIRGMDWTLCANGRDVLVHC